MNLHHSNASIVIIGGGITGLTIARELSGPFGNRVLVIEREPAVGGLAATALSNNIAFDCGSHRIHIDTDPNIISYIEQAIGTSLLKRRRSGRLMYRGKQINYPPSMLNFLSCFGPAELSMFLGSFIAERCRLAIHHENNFESAMTHMVGRRFYETFYDSYARKLWGLPPQTISADAKRKRNLLNYRMLYRTIFRGSHHYLYPPQGTGSITDGLARQVRDRGGRLLTSACLSDVKVVDGRIAKLIIRHEGQQKIIDAGLVISTIQLDDLYRMVFTGEDSRLCWRGARMAHLLLETKVPGENETYYFPDTDVTIGRVSDISKYSPHLNSSATGTLLTVETPCSAGDTVWQASDTELVELCLHDLQRIGILSTRPAVQKNFFTRLEKAYPLYTVGWGQHFEHTYQQLCAVSNLLTIGRNGLFLHCNIDHCIRQGLALADRILQPGQFDRQAWLTQADEFFSFSARD